jgi:hypothetical protein
MLNNSDKYTSIKVDTYLLISLCGLHDSYLKKIKTDNNNNNNNFIMSKNTGFYT